MVGSLTALGFGVRLFIDEAEVRIEAVTEGFFLPLIVSLSRCELDS